ncbi:MAG: carboxypeptidase-like regulatory domain-containing protein [Flavobacteriales bacterium]|nr:carboxypeptidase-like regulatory domain-containing protein [Flavobacteriales bacterium]
MRWSGLLFILVFATACATKQTYRHCIVKEAVATEVSKNELIEIADTNIAFISGQVLSKERNEPVQYAYLIVHDSTTNKKSNVFTDSLGNYTLQLSPGQYHVWLKSIGYSTFEDSLFIKKGEIRQIDFLMGNGRQFITADVTEKKRKSKKEKVSN